MLASSSHDDAVRAIAMVAAVVGVGVGVQWLAAWIRLPALVLLLVAGVVLGPVTGILVPDEALGAAQKPLISIAVALVLFEGGLTLRLREARAAGPVLWRLIVSGLVVGFATVTMLGIFVAGLEPATAAVLGAILVVTGPTVILPMLRTARISMRPATLLKWEGIVNDPLGALLAVVVFQLASAAPTLQDGLTTVAPELGLRALLSAAIGVSAGVLLGGALKRSYINEHLKSPVILASVLVVHAVAEVIGEENGLLAVTAMGLVMANEKDARIDDIRHFKEQISVLLVSMLFIVLSARLELADVEALLGWPLVLVFLIVFAVRPLIIAVATAGTDLPRNERLLLAWVAPRGIVAAAVAGAFETKLAEVGHDDARLLVPIVFGVIVGTVVLQGLPLGRIARKLGLSTLDGTGILIVGAPTWALGLAEALQKAGAYVVMSDTRYHRVSRARRSGLPAWFGDVLSEETDYEVPLERISWVFAATDDDAYNALVCHDFARDLGHERVLQPTPEAGTDRKTTDHGFRGRAPWGELGTYRAIAGAYWIRQQFKVTKLSEEFGVEQLRERNPSAVLLFQVVDGRVSPIEEKSKVPSGAKVVFLEERARWLAEEPAEGAATEGAATTAASGEDTTNEA